MSLTPKQQAAIKWWNKLPPGERTRLSAIYGVGVENCTVAHAKELAVYEKERVELDKLLGGK